MSLPPVASKPVAARRPVSREAAAAIEAMTRKTRAVIPKDALPYRLGKGTLAGSLNDQVRFRVQGTGPMSERRIVPDSPTARRLVETRQGQQLIGQLKVAISSGEGFEKNVNLKGFILPDDADSVVAGMLLGGAETGEVRDKILLGGMAASTGAKSGAAIRAAVREYRDYVNELYRQGAAAWNAAGWITFRPDVARAMLTSVGAYTPPAGSTQRWAGEMAEWVNHIPTHEMQHSISPVSVDFYQTPAKWMEEAVSEVMSNTPAVLDRIERKNGVTEKSYAGRLAHQSPIDLGWGPWEPPMPSVAEQRENQKTVSRNYMRSQDVLRDLLRMGGMAFNSNSGIEKVRTFLQGAPVESLSRRLADLIGDEQGVSRSRRTELADRISSIIDDPKGLANLRRDFRLG